MSGSGPGRAFEDEGGDIIPNPPYVEHTYDDEESVEIAELSGYTTKGKHTTSIWNDAPSKVKVTIKHDLNETKILIEEIEG